MPTAIDQSNRTRYLQEDLRTQLPRDRRWAAWWYGAIEKSPRTPSLPTTVIWFREVLPDNRLAGFARASIGIDKLSLVRLGSVWCNGIADHQIPRRQTSTFAIDLSDSGWSVTSQSEHFRTAGTGLIPSDDYPLRYPSGDRSKVLQFGLKDGKRLLVPCVEYYSMCFGHSAHVRRVLAAYSFDEALPKLCSRAIAGVRSDHWGIQLKPGCVRADAVFLAHVVHDPVASTAAKLVYSSMNTGSQASSGGVTPQFPEVRPWFTGPAQLKASGLWIDSGRSFLALQILGASSPDGPPISVDEVDRSSNDASEDSPDNVLVGGPFIVPGRATGLVSLTSADEPDRSSEAIDIVAPGLEVIGPSRIVSYSKQSRSRSRSGIAVSGDEASHFSGGERYGSSRGTGYVSIHTDVVLESKGALRDVWDALLFLESHHPDVILSVRWFDSANGVCQSSSTGPMLVRLNQPSDDHHSRRRRRSSSWLFADDGRSRTRGVLVACVQTSVGPVYLLEIERRRVRTETHFDETSEEDSFCGLVLRPSESLSPSLWIDRVLDGVSAECGVMARVLPYCPDGPRSFYRRSRSQSDQVTGQSTVLAALSKVGVRVARAH